MPGRQTQFQVGLVLAGQQQKLPGVQSPGIRVRVPNTRAARDAAGNASCVTALEGLQATGHWGKGR